MRDRKAYFCIRVEDKPPKKNNYWFCETPQRAADFESMERAKLQTSMWNAGGVNMPMQDGTELCWHDFKIEEWNGRFLIYALGPFLYDENRPEHQGS